MRFNIIGRWHDSVSDSTIEFYKNYDSFDGYFVDYYVNGEKRCDRTKINLAGYDASGIRLWNIESGVTLEADTLELMPDQRLRLFVSEHPGFERIFERVK